ncbi:MAG: DUF1640 domain-containing protein [Sphingomonadales bacterium]|nr:MAG: DUF1640 domain-containing protein [Sphingomonadales bacterium]
MSVDTLALARDLRAANLGQDQAEAIAFAIGRALTEGAASKADLSETRADLKADIQELRAELHEVRAELKAEIQDVRAELKSDIQELRLELKTDSASVRTELKTAIEGVKSTLLMWFVGTMLAFSGFIIAVVKFL